MGKYEPLAQYLKALSQDRWDAPFGEIERVLGFALPPSAAEYPAWWANQEGHHSQTKGWRDAGWETRNVDLSKKRVSFVRGRQGGTQRAKEPDSLEGLIERARAITGIDDQDDLLRHALATTIRNETAKNLIALGGSDPSAKAPRRRRYW